MLFDDNIHIRVIVEVRIDIQNRQKQQKKERKSIDIRFQARNTLGVANIQAMLCLNTTHEDKLLRIDRQHNFQTAH